MRKCYKFICSINLILLLSLSSKGQNVAINTTGVAANLSSMLEITSGSSGTLGLLIPRMTNAQRTGIVLLPAAAQGLVVYQTNTVGASLEGFYYNTSTTTTPTWNYLITSGATGGWLLTGNSGTTPSASAIGVAIGAGQNYVGTTDAKDFVIGTTNLERMRILSTGNVGIGTTTPGYPLTLVSPDALGLEIQNSGSANKSWRLKPLGNNLVIAETGISTPITFQAGGNVGIGTLAPGKILTVSSTTANDGINLTNGTRWIQLMSGTVGAGSYNNITQANDNAIIFSNGTMGQGALVIAPWAAASSGLRMDNNGNVGIGATNPAYTLDLNQGTFGFGASNQRTEWRTDAGLQGNAGAQSGFFQNDGSIVTNYPAGASGWWHLIDCRHSNTANNYAMQFAGSFFDQNLYFRKTNNNPAQPWVQVMTSNTGSKPDMPCYTCDGF